MPRKSKAVSNQAKGLKTALSPHSTPYPSLLESPSPADRRAQLEKALKEKAFRTMGEEEFDKFIDETSGWPADEDLNEFLQWLYQARRSGRYS
jgi:hypothetical protein